MPTVAINGQNIFYAARGSHGAPLVFIHGAGDSHLLWNGQVAAFANMARAFALDLPGHGRSLGAGRETILDYAIAVREFLDALQLERAILVGVSMGGAIVQTVALEFPERLLGLGLIGTGAKLRVAPAFLQGVANDFENTARVLAQNFYAPNAPAELIDKSAAQLIATGSRVTYHDFAACDAFDVRTRLSEIHAPTLVVCGSDDKMTPPKSSEYLAQNIAGAELLIIENAGHMVMLEQPILFHQVLKNWLDESALK
jgi:pimeloyl-ACP methyl ester carboxylesterase